MGENTYKINGKQGVMARPIYAPPSNIDSTKPVLFSKQRKERKLVVTTVGLNTVKIGNKVKLTNSDGRTINTQNKNIEKLEGISDDTWIIDEVKHEFSTDSYLCHLTLSPLILKSKIGEDLIGSRLRMMSPAERQRVRLADFINEKIALNQQGFNGLLLADTYIRSDRQNRYMVDVSNESGETLQKEISASTQMEVLKVNDQQNMEDIPRQGEISDEIFNGTKVVANMTSTWAMSYLDTIGTSVKDRPSGIWFPRFPQVDQNRSIKNTVYKHRLHKVGRDVFLGLADWSKKVPPLCYYSDYMLKTPARSVHIMPTHNFSGAQQDAGSSTLIASQMLFDANPLTAGNARGILDRPNIRDMLAKLGDGNGVGTVDDQLALTVTNATRSKMSKILIRNTDSAFDVPEIHVITDDGKAANSRVEMILKDDASGNGAVEINNKKQQILMDVNTGKITITLDTTTNDERIVIESGKITLDATTLRIDGNLEVDGDIDASGVITGGASI